MLAALDERIEGASLALLAVGHHRFAPYGFTEPDTFALAAQVLRVPEDLLRLGDYLFQGFPEDPRSIVDHLRRARAWLAALPVAADLSSATREFAFWRLTDERDGVITFVRRPDVRVAVEAVAIALRGDDEVDRARAREAARRVDDEVYEHLRALETAVLAADVGRSPDVAAALEPRVGASAARRVTSPAARQVDAVINVAALSDAPLVATASAVPTSTLLMRTAALWRREEPAAARFGRPAASTSAIVIRQPPSDAARRRTVGSGTLGRAASDPAHGRPDRPPALAVDRQPKVPPIGPPQIFHAVGAVRPTVAVVAGVGKALRHQRATERAVLHARWRRAAVTRDEIAPARASRRVGGKDRRVARAVGTGEARIAL